MLYRVRMVPEYTCSKCDFTTHVEEEMKAHICAHYGIPSIELLEEYATLHRDAQRATWERSTTQNERTIDAEDAAYKRIEEFEKKYNIHV